MATKMESRGGTRPTKVSFNRANHQPTAAQIGQLSDANHEMHIKMSKKIAQLTKVIYSLNSKNDDHEEIVEGLKNAHKEELEKVMVESKEKIGHYKQKLELVKEQESLISKLQNLLEDERQEKHKFLEDFEDFKSKKSDLDTEVKKKYEIKMIEMTSKLTLLKDEYENRTQKFESITRKLEYEKENMTSELSHKHSLEMDKLIKAHRVRFDELKSENDKLQKNIENLQMDSSSVVTHKNTEIEKLVNENNIKCDKLKSFYENELAAAKRKHEQVVEEMTEKLKKEEKLLNLSLKRNEEELRNRLRSVTNENESLESKLEELETCVANLKKELNQTVHNKDDYSREISSLKQNLSSTEMRFEHLQNELSSMKDRFNLQNKELLKKSAELGALEAMKIANVNSINDLTAEVARLNKKCNELESERKTLGSRLSANSSEAHLQIRELQRDLQRRLEEKESTVTKYEQLLTESHEKHSEEIRDLTLNKEKDFATIIEKNSTELCSLKRSYEKELDELQAKLISSKDKEIGNVKEEHQNILLEKEQEIVRLKDSCCGFETEIGRLNGLLIEQKSNQETASDCVQSLEENVRHAQLQLKQTEEKLKKSQNEVQKLQGDSTAMQKEHSRSQLKAADDSKRKLKELAAQLDNQWDQKLRNECEKLRSDLARKHREESEASLSHITAMKDGEIEAYKTELQQQIVKYQKQITDLKSDIQTIKADSERMVRRNAEEFSKQRIKYEEEIAKIKFGHSAEVESLYLENERNLKNLSEKNISQLKEAEQNLKSEHQENITAIMLANRSSIDALKADAQRTKEKELEDLANTHAEEKDVLRHTLHVQHQDDIEQINLEFEEEMQTIKDELQKTKDLRSKEFEIHAAKIEELSNAIIEKEEEVKELEKELGKIQENIKALNQELEAKVGDIKKARREGNLNLRRREQQLAKEHQDEVDTMTAEHLRETQRMLAEFNKAKELLKDKVEALQILLEQAEERYRNRESRTEDLEKIDQLKTMTAEREMECRKLVEEKRYFQMELLNRETNFNKIFNNYPTVGVMNPLDTGKKKRKGSKEPWNSAGSRHSIPGQSSGTTSPARLEPLPHSQIHEQRLNNSKPLPRAPVHGS